MLYPNADDFTMLGNLYSFDLNPIKNQEKELENYEKAIKLAPNNPKGYEYRASLFKRNKKYKEAIADYTTLIRLLPKANYYLQRANIYFDLANYQGAINDLSKAILLDESWTYLYEKRGDTFIKLKKYSAAIKDFKLIMTKFEGLFACDGYKGLGDVFSAQNKYDSALKNYSKAIELCSDEVGKYEVRANFFTKFGKHILAEKDLKMKKEVFEKNTKYFEELLKDKRN